MGLEKRMVSTRCSTIGSRTSLVEAAVGLDVPELSSRLEYIRHEVDAKEEVEEIDAATDQG